MLEALSDLQTFFDQSECSIQHSYTLSVHLCIIMVEIVFTMNIISWIPIKVSMQQTSYLILISCPNLHQFKSFIRWLMNQKLLT